MTSNQYEIPSEYVTTGEACVMLGFQNNQQNKVKIKKILIRRDADQFQLQGCRGRPLDLWSREEIERFAKTPVITQRVVEIRVKQA